MGGAFLVSCAVLSDWSLVAMRPLQPSLDPVRRQRLFETVERVTEIPMLVLAAAMIPVIVLPLAFDLSSGASTALNGVSLGIWAVFATELVVKTYLAPERRRYLITHWFDVLIVVIPFLRPLRVLRAVRLLRLLRLLQVAALLSRLSFSWVRLFGRHGLGYILLICSAAVIAIAAGVTIVEHTNPSASIEDFPTALWWAITTVTTVGYGDTAPITGPGRILGVLLMLVGISVFGIFAAGVAAFFVESDTEQRSNADLADEVRELRSQIADLRNDLTATPANVRSEPDSNSQ